MKKLNKALIILILLLAVIGILSYLVFYNQTEDLEVIFFDIGQGDSIFITTPSGQQILIDGGPDRTVLSKLGRAMPFYDHTIDLIILSHAHADHVAGLIEVLKKYEVKKIIYSPVQYSSNEFREWQDTIIEQGIETSIPLAGQVYNFGQASLEILYPLEDISGQKFDDVNDSSVIAKLTYQDSSFLFTGDASVEIEQELLEIYCNNDECPKLDSNILKIGHHGSKYSSSLEFLQAVTPDTAIIQSKTDNSYGHPHRLILKRLEGLGIEVLRNDEVGDIKIVK